MEAIGEKKLAAIMAAVGAYMAGEEEAVLSAMMPRAARQLPAPVRLWGASGRREQMDQRWMMQMRMFR